MEVTTEPKTQIDEASHRNLSFSTPIAGDPSSDKLPFFSATARGRSKRDTWLVSVLVLLQIVVFAVTMGVNDCSRNSNGHCAAKLLGRFSFQPLSENPMLGPSASTFEHMGGLYWNALVEKHEIWRGVLTSPWLHSGLFHLLINLGSLIFVGIFMEQRYGPFRIAVIYFLSGMCGKSVCCVVCSKHPINLFWCCFLWIDWSYAFCTCKELESIYLQGFSIGDNNHHLHSQFPDRLSSLRQDPPPHKGKLFEDDMRSSTRLKEMFDRPVLRIVCLVLFCGILSIFVSLSSDLLGVLIAACWGVNLNRHCNWCRYVDCVPTRKWSCSDMTTSCEEMVSDAQLTLTCMANGKFRIFPYTNISQARTQDLCTLVCT
ncbi:Rhomboid-related intramembrane serine protease family protein [Raphanus sativus]|nr:Rhomboid-related intramembrane serine protease family protein [Raphanus sativus]